MLDRKTKNVDANVELLLDRKKFNSYFCLLALSFGAASILLGVFIQDVFLSVIGIGLLAVSIVYTVFDVQYRLLVQCRKIMNCQQNQILLINEALNDLDSLDDQFKVGKKVRR